MLPLVLVIAGAACGGVILSDCDKEGHVSPGETEADADPADVEPEADENPADAEEIADCHGPLANTQAADIERSAKFSLRSFAADRGFPPIDVYYEDGVPVDGARYIAAQTVACGLKALDTLGGGVRQDVPRIKLFLFRTSSGEWLTNFDDALARRRSSH